MACDSSKARKSMGCSQRVDKASDPHKDTNTVTTLK